MKKKALSITAICLAAVLLCGAFSLGTATYVIRSLEKRIQPVSEGAPATLQAAGLAAAAASGRQLDATEIYDLACAQVVGISTEVTATNVFGQTISGAVTGTGFILAADGYILTNHHVVEKAYKEGYDVTVILHDGSKYKAEIVGVEDDNDIAVLKIDAKGLTPVVLGDSADVRVGESVYVVGNPLGQLTYTMTGGIVSALDRDIAVAKDTVVNMFQLDAAVNNGNSGGPVYNSLGQVVGVVTAKYKLSGVEGLSFAIPVNDAAEIAAELMAHGYVTGKPSLGITVVPMTEQYADYCNSVVGLYVSAVNAGSCAENAGLIQGDVITKLNDTPIATTADMTAAKKEFHAGDKVELTVFRAGEYLTLEAVFDEETPESEEPSASAVMPTPVPREEPASPDPQQPGESWEDAMRGFFDNFFNYFGGEITDAPAEGETEREDSGGWSHFGG